MKLAVDTDVLLGSLAGDGAVRRLVVLGGLDLVTLQDTFEALRSHVGLVLARTGTDDEELLEALDILGRYVEEAPFPEYEEAYTGLEMSYPWADVREVDLLALAKALDLGIWSMNPALSQVEDLDVLRTEDVFDEVVR